MTDMTFEQLCEQFGYTPKNRPLSGPEVAEFYGTSLRTVDGWRVTGTGPRFFSPPGSRRVWYSEVDVLRWLASGEKRSTSDQPRETLDLQRTNTPARPVQALGAARRPAVAGARNAAQS